MSSKLDHLKSPMIQPLAYRSQKGEKMGIVYRQMPIFNLIFAGHVDAGKSTLTGELLLASGAVSQHTLEQYRKQAASMGKESFAKAWVTDIHPDQRGKGVTMDIAHVELFTGNRYYTIIDAPGHKDYMKNMITGAGQADVLALLIDTQALYNRIKEWVKNFQSPQTHPLKQWSTIEHATICRAFGVKHAIMVMNKMDMFPQSQGSQVFRVVKEFLSKAIKNAGYQLDHVSWVPVSAYRGVGIRTPYPGIQGNTSPGLMEVLDKMDLGPDMEELPLRVNVETVLKEISGTNVVVTGKIQSGKLRPGDMVLLKPSGIKAQVRSIQMHRKNLVQAGPRYNVGIDLKGVTGSLDYLKKLIGRNTVISHQDHAPKVASQFTANVIIRGVPSQDGLQAGKTKIIVHQGCGFMSCLIKDLRNPVDLVSRKPIATGSVQAVLNNTMCQMVLVPDQPIVVEPKSSHPKNSHIMLRESNVTLGWGSVTSIVPSQFQISK